MGNNTNNNNNRNIVSGDHMTEIPKGFKILAQEIEDEEIRDMIIYDGEFYIKLFSLRSPSEYPDTPLYYVSEIYKDIEIQPKSHFVWDTIDLRMINKVNSYFGKDIIPSLRAKTLLLRKWLKNEYVYEQLYNDEILTIDSLRFTGLSINKDEIKIDNVNITKDEITKGSKIVNQEDKNYDFFIEFKFKNEVRKTGDVERKAIQEHNL